MGHQDNGLELRSMMAAEEAREPKATVPEEVAATPLALDHDDVPSWRQTARFFRSAA